MNLYFLSFIVIPIYILGIAFLRNYSDSVVLFFQQLYQTAIYSLEIADIVLAYWDNYK